jgi:hypothetical protein
MGALGLLCLTVRPDAGARRGASVRMNRLPHRTLWAWERPEDLTGIDPSTTAVAWLDQTILLGRDATSQPRRQPLSYPTGMAKIAVVRIEALAGFSTDGNRNTELERQAVKLLLDSARRPAIAALQIDFDATRSQRGFYSDLISDLRRQMPKDLPLSITALASWCSYDDWIGNLPVDEAVPMFFRMEPDRRMAPADLPQFRIREPLCMGSAGISTREAWPDGLIGKRIYVFADRGWQRDLSLLAVREKP